MLKRLKRIPAKQSVTAFSDHHRINDNPFRRVTTKRCSNNSDNFAIIEHPHLDGINSEIRVPEVRLTGVDGAQIGIVRTSEALRMAEDAGVDLVEVAPNAVPPVCRLMDYGKFRYQEQKKAQEAKAKQKVVQIKEVKFRPATDENDFQTKLRSLKRFLEDGDKAKITLRFRGREMAHQQFGTQLMDRVREELVDIAQVEHAPKLEGRQMIMVLAPKKKR